MSNFTMNEAGGLTYASRQRVGRPEQRSEALSEVRMVIDGLQELCENIRRSWPERYPMPEDLDALLKFQDYALARVRSGALRSVAQSDCEG